MNQESHWSKLLSTVAKTLKRKLGLLSAVLCTAAVIGLFIPMALAAPPFPAVYGGAKLDIAYSTQQTNDGGYIVAGRTMSFGAGSDDIWLLKLDPSGGIEWQKTYGRVDYDFANAIQQTNDSGYMVMAWTETFPGSNAYDIWLLKLDSDSHIIWQKTYGGPASDLGFSIQQTNDSGYIVAGRTNPFADCWNILLLKIDSNGQVAWQKRYGGIDSSGARSVQQTNDGDYIVAGWAHSLGVVSMPDDQVVLRLDQDGNASGCPLGKPFTGQVNDTTVAGAGSSAVTGDTAATVVNTDVSPANSSAKPDHVCESRYLPSISCNR